MSIFLDTLIYSSQLITIVIAVVQWRHHKNTTERYFVFYLATAVSIDLAGYFFPLLYGYNMMFIYNILILICFSFYLYWFFTILNKSKLIVYLAIILGAVICYSILFVHFYTKLWSDVITVGTILILVCTTFFYSKLLKQEELENYFTSRKFWIVTGLLIFYVGYLPLHLFQKLDNSVVHTTAYLFALTILNIILYGFISIGLLCKRNTQT